VIPPEIDSGIGEYLIPGEAGIMNDYLAIFYAHFKKHYEGKPGTARRGIHAKSHGCLRATLEIFDHGDPELQHGIFRAPASYEALVRVSNGDGPPGPDTARLVSVGFAIKVLGVEAEKFFAEQTEKSQDFLFLSQASYISRDVRGYRSLMKAIDGGIWSKLRALFCNFRGIWTRVMSLPKDDPLNTHFWGIGPQRLGAIAVKYLIRPCDPVPKDNKKLRSLASADYLKPLMREHIESREANFDFFLQKRLLNGRENRDMPIEDFAVPWDETKSVPIRVGKLRIARQSLDAELDRRCEDMVFTPWNTTKDFRPLGSLNRARLVVYTFSVRCRHEINHHGPDWKLQNPVSS
jgi:hypothetical protein